MVIFLYLKKYIILVLPLCLAVCSKKNAQPAAENGGGTRIVTDKFGRELEIPQTVKTIICLGSGPPRMAAYMGVMDMLVGSEEHDAENLTVLRDYNPVYHDALKTLPIVWTGGGSGLPPIFVSAADSNRRRAYKQVCGRVLNQTPSPINIKEFVSNIFK